MALVASSGGHRGAPVDQKPRAARRAHGHLVVCLAALAVCIWQGRYGRLGAFLFPQAQSATDVDAPVSRRSLLQSTGGLSLSLLPAILGSWAPEPANAQILGAALFNPCRCCETDWCVTGCTEQKTGVTTPCDCHEYLEVKASTSNSRSLNKKPWAVPRDASRARLDSVQQGKGEQYSAKDLLWEQTSLPRWRAENGSHLVVRASSFGEAAGKGLFASAALPKWSVLPPYLGKPMGTGDLLKVRATPAMDYVWCAASEEPLLNLTDAQLQAVTEAGAATTFCVDSAKVSQNNPTRFINGAKDLKQCNNINVEICEFGKVAYFRTTRAVPAGAELVTDYGPSYWDDFRGC
ncbi:unnamed protein product [Polarella glacialis]|uniref:SET domain-containing protein n=1 Tax=Polarella glacialis TaxID=89957 RepID=A0A813HT15_POLGL|nr:unnamed protein product [Polarella glacialis]|mmetsp:Transcript_53044/g.95470  ORF Transcript_53044/g.95470 Transcript_53044/m.95470 type:complete len:349 (-) Transcript_53044:60-1106(-)